MSLLTASLIKQMSLNLKRIHSLGINKVAVGLLEPMGCVPLLTAIYSYENCDETFNSISQNHSQMLLQTVQELNKEIGKSVFVTLDLYNSFLSTIATMQKRHASKFSLCMLLLITLLSWAKVLKIKSTHIYFQKGFQVSTKHF